MDVRILGPVEVVVDGTTVALGAAKLRALLAVLVLHRDQVVSVDALAEALWGEEVPDSWAVTLQGYVSQVRKLLGAGAITTRARGYMLAAGPQASDAGRFDALVSAGRTARGEGRPDEAAELLEQALALWRGPALGEFADLPFAHAEAARLEELRLVATEELVEAQLARGGHGEVVGRLRSLVDAHPLRERLWGQLMVALYRSGRGAEALRAYAELRRHLGEELGIEPGPALRILEQDVLLQRPELDWRPPAPPAPDDVPTNLPTARSSFVGRHDELAALDKALSGPGLLTLVGPGGVGKTRLATEVARGLRPRYPDGVWLVELAPLSDPSLVPQAVAAAVGVREEPGRPLTDTLARALAPRRDLLVLDNCEHVVAAAAALADALLGAAPDLVILATSREPLRVEGEVVWPTMPMPVPAGDDLPAEAVAGIDAVRLFCERAGAQGPFALTADNAGAVSALCRGLDGIPLAIELAAARTAALSPAQILDRLDQRFRLLRTGRRSVPRHETLAAAVEWSHDLLSDDERTLFRRLSVFRGFPLDGAEQVCAGDGLERSRIAALVADLVDRSLVVAQPNQDGLRYSLLETLRTYAAHRLAASGEEDDVRRRHLGWAISHAEASVSPYRAISWGASDWVDRMRAEHDNVRAALRWSLTSDAETAVRLGSALAPFWVKIGSFTEGRDLLGSALAVSAGVAPRARAVARRLLGELCALQGDFEVARPLLDDAVSVLRELGETKELGEALGVAGFLESEEGEPRRAKEHLVEAVAVLRDIGDDRGAHYAMYSLASVASKEGDYEMSNRLFDEALAALPDASPLDFAMSLINQGELKRAEALLEPALAAARDADDKRLIILTLAQLARLARVTGDLGAARDRYEEELRLAREVGLENCAAQARRGLARIALEEGRVDVARPLLLQGVAGAGAHGRYYQAQSIDTVAALELARGEFERAALLFGAGEVMRAQVGAKVLPVEAAARARWVAAVRDALGDDAFLMASDRGRSLSWDEAVAVAIGDSGSAAPAAGDHPAGPPSE